MSDRIKRHFSDDNEEDPRDEKLFELWQENIRLRGQITYLQEQLAEAEDQMSSQSARFADKIADLENQLGSALFGRGQPNK